MEPPPTLRWVLGGLSGSNPQETITTEGCEAVLTLINTGNTSIQIPKIGVQLKARPQPNTYQYRLIDLCSFQPQPQGQEVGCFSPQGGGGGCNVYFATFQLGLGEKNDVFSAVPQGTNYSLPGFPDCGILTLAPTAQVQLSINFSLAASTPNNLIYSIVPIFTVNTAQGEQRLALSQLSTTLAFAGINQFSCYGLQGTTFVLLKSTVIPPHWCV